MLTGSPRASSPFEISEFTRLSEFCGLGLKVHIRWIFHVIESKIVRRNNEIKGTISVPLRMRQVWSFSYAHCTALSLAIRQLPPE
jgi:hypothetical protein